MPMSDAQKRARNNWDKENMIVMPCKMKKDEAEAFKAACKAAGTTPNAVFKEAARRIINTAKEGRE